LRWSDDFAHRLPKSYRFIRLKGGNYSRKVHNMQVKEKLSISTVDRHVDATIAALLNTGAKFTYISDVIGKQLGFTAYKEPRDVHLAVKGAKGTIVGEASLIFTLDGLEMPLPVQAYVVHDLAEEAVIGTNFMEGFDVQLDLREGRARLRKYPPEVILI